MCIQECGWVVVYQSHWILKLKSTLHWLNFSFFFSDITNHDREKRTNSEHIHLHWLKITFIIWKRFSFFFWISSHDHMKFSTFYWMQLYFSSDLSWVHLCFSSSLLKTLSTETTKTRKKNFYLCFWLKFNILYLKDRFNVFQSRFQFSVSVRFTE